MAHIKDAYAKMGCEELASSLNVNCLKPGAALTSSSVDATPELGKLSVKDVEIKNAFYFTQTIDDLATFFNRYHTQ